METGLQQLDKLVQWMTAPVTTSGIFKRLLLTVVLPGVLYELAFFYALTADLMAGLALAGVCTILFSLMAYGIAGLAVSQKRTTPGVAQIRTGRR